MNLALICLVKEFEITTQGFIPDNIPKAPTGQIKANKSVVSIPLAVQFCGIFMGPVCQ